MTHGRGAAGAGDEIALDSVLTCPHCGRARRERMPVDACQFFYECTQCNALLRPRRGDCCVYCYFGSVKCPSIQASGGCCADST